MLLGLVVVAVVVCCSPKDLVGVPSKFARVHPRDLVWIPHKFPRAPPRDLVRGSL